MFEHVFQFGQVLLFANEFSRLQFGQVVVQALPRFRNRFQHAIEKTAPDDRRHAQDLFDLFVQPIHARHDDALNRVGNVNRFDLRRRPPAPA